MLYTDKFATKLPQNFKNSESVGCTVADFAGIGKVWSILKADIVKSSYYKHLVHCDRTIHSQACTAAY